MMRISGLVPLALLLAACGPSFVWEGDEDPGVDAFEHAIADRVGTSLEDGTPVEVLTVVVSNDPNLCARIAQTPDGQLAQVEDVLAVQVLGIRVGDLTPFTTNAGFVQAFLAPEDGLAAVAVNLVEREGGVTVADIGTDNLLDGAAISDSRLSITSQGLSNGEIRSLAGSFEAEITLDRTDPETVDVDVDGDGSPDYRRISASVQGRFSGADGCPSLSGT